MNYTVKDRDTSYHYDVTYNEKNLKEIMKGLKEFIRFKQGKSEVPFDKPIMKSKKAIEKGVVWFFNCYVRPYYDGALINSDSIKYDKEKKCILFTYNYETYPDLYYYLDSLVNKIDIKYYSRILNIGARATYCDEEQLVIQGIFNCNDSFQLSDADKKVYDIMGQIDLDDLNIGTYTKIKLKKLHSEALENIYFRLASKTQELHNQECVNGCSLVLKKSR